ncbi:MAG: hypothetical protein OHK0026_06230 [Rhodocyclaceae bacterium]
MAKAAVKAVPAAEPKSEAGGKGASKKKILLIAILGLVLGGGGAGAWFYLHAGGAQHAPQEKPAAPPTFVNLEPFTVNLQPDGAADQYLQAVAVLRVADGAAAEKLKQYMPELRHRVLLLLSSKKAADMGTPAGREQLAEQLRAEANRILASAAGKAQRSAGPIAGQAPHAGTPAPPAPEDPVQSVLFTSFIIQ